MNVTLAWPLAIVLIVFFARTANSHEWMPESCCHGRDCWPIEDSEISSSKGAFTIRATGQVIPFNAPEVHWGENPTIKFYRCTTRRAPDIYTHCLFPPAAGT